MGRLFDSSKIESDANQARAARRAVEERAAEVDAVLADHQELDEQSQKIRNQLAAAQAVSPIVYEEYRQPGSKWMIEHATDGSDYIFQLFPIRPPKLEKRAVLELLIIAMDQIFPQSVRIDYVPPNDLYKAVMYTIKVRDVTKLPGWEEACRTKALRGLVAVDAWPVPA